MLNFGRRTVKCTLYFNSVYMEQLFQIPSNIGQRRLFTYPKPIFELYSTGYNLNQEDDDLMSVRMPPPRAPGPIELYI